MRWRPVLAIVILLMTAVIASAVLIDMLELGSFAGPYRLSHWAAWLGALFVAIYAPAYHFLKRARPKSASLLLDIHSFGFLLAFLLITVHFTSQLSRPPQSYPELGEGIALFIAMVMLVATGMIQRFAAPSLGTKGRYTARTNRAVHVSLLSAFYIIIVVHIVQGLS
jgi:cytochrome b561